MQNPPMHHCDVLNILPLAASLSAPAHTPPLQINLGVSVGALFDLSYERRLRQERGDDAYFAYMNRNIDKPFTKGAAWATTFMMRKFNKASEKPVFFLTLFSPLSAITAQRVHMSLAHHGLATMTRPLREQGITAYYGEDAMTSCTTQNEANLDLVLSTRPDDVMRALENGIPAGHVVPQAIPQEAEPRDFVVGFDLDRVGFVFLGKPGTKDYFVDNEAYTKENGLDAARAREQMCSTLPGHPGPLAPYLTKLFQLRALANPDRDRPNLQLLAITARCGTARTRAQNTLESYNMIPDDLISTGWDPKGPIVAEKGVGLFLDDGQHHVENVRDSSPNTLVAHMPWTQAHIDRIRQKSRPEKRAFAQAAPCCRN